MLKIIVYLIQEEEENIKRTPFGSAAKQTYFY